ncbi:S41 family peptidase [Lewinella sp. IMCC34183]|uniref:S41 family peptidase n=1 Tax=Lewinella sp. IMCC34183 TaxID=2248762 RepID=UPI000E234912|nr:S41 family peptidase [Lewinella sp. IMCC34183]
MRFLPVCLLFLLCVSTGCRHESEHSETDNLVAFGRLVGYVRFFHPTEAAAELDWDKFIAYGCEQVIGCRTSEELEARLNRLFFPIAPTLVLGSPDQLDDGAPPPLSADTVYTFWQHQGVDLKTDQNGGAYASRRVEVRHGRLQDSLFAAVPQRRVVVRPLSRDLVCRLPLVLPVEETAPPNSADSLTALMANIAPYSFDARRPESRFANVITTYNVLRHFYPYFDVVEVDWPEEMRRALIRSVADRTKADHVNTLLRMTAALDDGHVQVRTESQEYFPPIYWEWINDTLTITRVVDTTLDISVGQVVTGIEGMSVDEYFSDVMSILSAGTDGWRAYRSQRQSLSGDRSSPFPIEVDGVLRRLTRHIPLFEYYPLTKVNQTQHRSYPDGIEYVNLDMISMEELTDLLPELSRASGLLFDLRGYPNGNHGLINHLMTQPDTVSAWMKIPQIVYPDGEEPVGYSPRNWIDFMQPQAPFLGERPVVFLTDGRAVSYAESFLGFVKGYGLGTLMGQPTAGANGNVNTLHLPGEISITFTGMQVTQHDGSRLHGVGIQPDVYLERSVAGVREGRDEFLEAGLNYLRDRRNK